MAKRSLRPGAIEGRFAGEFARRRTGRHDHRVRRRGLRYGVLAAAFVMAGCGGSSHKHVTIDDLAHMGAMCPVPLRDSVAQAGQYMAGPATGSAQPSGPYSHVGAIDGVAIDCSTTDEETSGIMQGGAVHMTLVALRHGAAVNVLLPDLRDLAGLNASQLDAVKRAAAATRSGHIVNLPYVVSGPPASLGIVTITGARSAAFLLTGQGASDTVGTRLASNIG